MANLEETAKWEDGVYQWETDDPVVGGPDGLDNVPTRQLANRTAYLKGQIEAHAAATDPHPQYLQQSEGDQLYDKTGAAASALQAHLNAADPHPQYLTETETAALIQQGTTAPQFDISTKNATTAFVQRALGNFSAYTMITAAATTLTAAQTGGCFLVNAASAAVTLPNAAQSNLTYTLYAGSAFTLTTPIGSIIGPNSSSASVSVAAHGSIKVVFDGGNWEIIGGSAVAPRTVATPAQFDSTNLIATTNFVQRALGNVQGAVGISANTQLTAANAGQLIIVSGNTSTITITLPSVSTISVGASFTFQFLTAYDCIISTGSSLALYGTGITSGTAITIPAYGNAVVTYDGLNFAVRTDSLIGTQATTDNSNRVASTAFVKNNFLASTASPGYQRLASGVIIQWGKSYSPDDSYTAITFPTTFPNGCWVVTATPETTGAVSGANSIGVYVGSITTTTFSTGISLYNTAPSTGYIFWMAMGY